MWLAYVALVALLGWHHEPWRDELQAWGIARGSGGLGELFANLRYEGHPPLWHLPLFAMTRVTGDPAWMQALAGLVGAASAYVVLRWAPFDRLAKALLVFGYMLAFEYTVVARGYGMGALATLAACALWPSRRERPWALGLALGLLALTSVYGLVVAAAFGALLAWEASRGEWTETRQARPDAFWTGVGLATAGVLASVACLAGTPPDASPTPVLGGDAGSVTRTVLLAISRIGWAFAPLPALGPHPWNSALLTGWAPVVAAFAALAAVHFGFLRGRPRAALFFWVGAAGLMALSLGVFLGSMRHALHYQLIAIAGIWLAAQEGAVPRWLLAALLAPSVVAAAWLGGADLRAPFSNSGAMAAWIRAEGVDAGRIMATQDFTAIGVAARLDRPLYLLSAREPRRFVRWSAARFRTPEAMIEPLHQCLDSGQEVLLLTSSPLAPEERSAMQADVRLLHATEGALVRDEDYWLYRLSRLRRSSAPR